MRNENGITLITVIIIVLSLIVLGSVFYSVTHVDYNEIEIAPVNTTIQENSNVN